MTESDFANDTVVVFCWALVNWHGDIIRLRKSKTTSDAPQGFRWAYVGIRELPEVCADA